MAKTTTSKTAATKSTASQKPTQAADSAGTEIAVKDAWRHRPKPYTHELMTEHTNPGENRRYIEHSLVFFDMPKVDMSKPEQVRQRIYDYFKACADADMKPSMAGLAVAMHVDRRRLWEYREGRKDAPPETVELLRQVVGLLDLQMVDYMQNGKINPVAGIFLMKNNFGYADKQEVVLTPNNPLGESAQQAQLADKYLDLVDVGEE